MIANKNIVNISWAWTKDDVFNVVDKRGQRELAEILGVADEKVEGMDRQDIGDLLYDKLRHNRILPEDLFGLPGKMVIPNDWTDEDVVSFLEDWFGFYVEKITTEKGVKEVVA